MTEGTCEKAMLDVMLHRSLLLCSYNDLLYQEIFQARQINSKLLEMINQLSPEEKIIIIRVGDKLSDKLNTDEVAERLQTIYKVCIKPEFEILHTINDGLFKEYLKQKSKKKVSIFYSEKNSNYKKTYTFNYNYFNNLSDLELYNLVSEYNIKRKGAHKKDEKTLMFIVKEIKK